MLMSLGTLVGEPASSLLQASSGMLWAGSSRVLVQQLPCKTGLLLTMSPALTTDCSPSHGLALCHQVCCNASDHLAMLMFIKASRTSSRLARHLQAADWCWLSRNSARGGCQAMLWAA